MWDKLKRKGPVIFRSLAKFSPFSRKNVVFGITVFLCPACALFQGKEKYTWAELDGARDLECIEWPGVEDMASLADVVIQGPQGASGVGSVVGTGIDRKGRHALAIGRFRPAKSLSSDDVAVLSFKGKPPRIIQGNCALGSRQEFSPDTPDEIRESPLFLLTNGEPESLQLRRAADNNVLATSAPLPAAVRADTAIATGTGCMLMARDEEDQPSLFHVQDGDKLLPVNLAAMKVPFPKGRWLKATRQKDQSVLVVAVPGDGLKGAQEVPWALIHGSALKSAGVVSFKTALGVDGADVLPVEGGIYLIAVGGDSLVGEAKLHLSFYNADQQVTAPVWSHTVTLEHVHLAPPRLVRRGPTGAFALLPKWVDRESTVGSYRLSPKGFKQSENRGVFPEPASILDTVETSVGALALVKFRRDKDWQHNLCEIDW
ncbi:MAG: hypothetical protein RIQ81_1763 [Pseudomonadota bacterium]